MVKKENYAETLSDFRKHMQQCKGMTFEQDPEFEKWLDNFETEIRKVSQKMLKKLPKSCRKEGFAEAYFVGLARFTCRILNQMERHGMFSEGKDGFGFYTKVILPVCNDMVVSEMDEDERAEKVMDAVVADISLAVYRSREVADDSHSRKSSFESLLVREHREMFVFVFTRIEVKIECSDLFAVGINIVGKNAFVPNVIAFDLFELKAENLGIYCENSVKNFLDFKVGSYCFGVVVELFHSDKTRIVESVPRLDFNIFTTKNSFFLRKKDFCFFLSVRH